MTVFYLIVLTLLPVSCYGQTQQIMFTHRRSCRRPHHYQAESHYLVRAKGPLPARHCNMTFAESEWSANSPDQQCYSLCIKLINASMTSCDFKMTYYDGIGDPKPRTFNCKSYPPSLWCSSHMGVTVELRELDSYDRRGVDGYDLTLEIKPYCHQPASTVPGDAYLDHYLRKEKRDRDTIIIAGSLVSTICFLFVIFWLVYCCWKRQTPRESYQRSTTPLSHQNSFKSSGSGRKGPGTSHSSNGDRTEAKNWYPMTTRSPPKYQPPVYSSQGWDAPADNSRYTELPGTSYSPQRGPTQGFHLRQFSQGEPYNPLAPIREQPPMYKLTFEVTERSHDPGMPFRGPPPLPPRPNTVQRPSKQYYI